MPFAVFLNQYTNTRGFTESRLELLHVLHDSFKSVLILKYSEVSFRFLWTCIVSKVRKEKTNKMQQLDFFYMVYCLLHYRGNTTSFTFLVVLCTSYSLTLIFTVMLYTLHSFDYCLLLWFRLYRYFVSLILDIVLLYIWYS